jgi:hypothetical protein
MTESKRPLKVFLCHAHSDKDTVKARGGRVGGVLPPYRDHNRLTKDGVDRWSRAGTRLAQILDV